eukprot:SAG31_NODE_42450_length_271_cov_1.191860_1_plen_68_part_00
MRRLVLGLHPDQAMHQQLGQSHAHQYAGTVSDESYWIRARQMKRHGMMQLQWRGDADRHAHDQGLTV